MSIMCRSADLPRSHPGYGCLLTPASTKSPAPCRGYAPMTCGNMTIHRSTQPVDHAVETMPHAVYPTGHITAADGMTTVEPGITTRVDHNYAHKFVPIYFDHQRDH